VALVTGAARGIGVLAVRSLVADDLAVVAVDRCADHPRLPSGLGSEEELRAVVAVAPGRSEAFIGDTCHLAAMVAAVDRAEQRFGGRAL
jgi:NAD(P)-dependent dehydrogenase (short-subunit alcohol dehydrogenase family)